MKIEINNNDLWVSELIDFRIGQTLECGQSFHFEKTNNDEYIIIAHNRILKVKEHSHNTVVFYDTTKEEFENVWIKYFDLDRDYSEIKRVLLEKDDKLRTAIEEKNGVRIMNQDFFEMLLSFIISQNKQIPHIKKIVFDISQKWGNYLGRVNDKAYYSFPTKEQMAGCTIEDFIQLKTGFRAPYLYDAVNKVLSGEISEEYAKTLDSSCFVCNRIENTFNRYLITMLHLYKTDKSFQDKLNSSKGLCTTHYSMLYDLAATNLSGDTLTIFYNDINKLYIDNMKRVRDDLDWFISKFDYRFANEPWKNSKDALPRAITKTNSIVNELQ